MVPAALAILAGDPNPHFFNWPSLYMYGLAGASALYGAWLRWTQGLSAVEAFLRDPGRFYLLGRLVTAACGVASVGLVYRLGVRVSGPPAGLAAAFFLAVDLQHVVDSHFATADVPMAAGVLAAMLATVRYLERGRPVDALLAGGLGGLAASVKYNGALVGAAFLAAHAFRLRAAADPRRAFLGDAAGPAWLLGAVLGFLTGTPYALLAPGEFWGGVFGEVGAIQTVQFGNEGDLPAVLFHLLHTLPQALGVPLLAAAAGGMALTLRRRRPADILLLAVTLPYLAIIGTWASRFERYAVPLLPFLGLLAALALEALVRGRRGGGLLFAAAAVLAAAPVTVRAGYYAVLIGRADSREVAAGWIERHLPTAILAMEPYSPPVRWRDTAGLVHRVTSPPLGGPPLPIAAALPRRPPPGPWAAGPRIAPLTTYDLGALRARGIQYVVLSSYVYQRHRAACAVFAAACRFYGQLEQEATLVWAIEPVPEARRLWVGDIYAPASHVLARSRPGPNIRIYRLGKG